MFVGEFMVDLDRGNGKYSKIGNCVVETGNLTINSPRQIISESSLDGEGELNVKECSNFEAIRESRLVFKKSINICAIEGNQSSNFSSEQSEFSSEKNIKILNFSGYSLKDPVLRCRQELTMKGGVLNVRNTDSDSLSIKIEKEIKAESFVGEFQEVTIKNENESNQRQDIYVRISRRFYLGKVQKNIHLSDLRMFVGEFIVDLDRGNGKCSKIGNCVVKTGNLAIKSPKLAISDSFVDGKRELNVEECSNFELKESRLVFKKSIDIVCPVEGNQNSKFSIEHSKVSSIEGNIKILNFSEYTLKDPVLRCHEMTMKGGVLNVIISKSNTLLNDFKVLEENVKALQQTLKKISEKNETEGEVDEKEEEGEDEGEEDDLRNEKMRNIEKILDGINREKREVKSKLFREIKVDSFVGEFEEVTFENETPFQCDFDVCMSRFDLKVQKNVRFSDLRVFVAENLTIKSPKHVFCKSSADGEGELNVEECSDIEVTQSRLVFGKSINICSVGQDYEGCGDKVTEMMSENIVLDGNRIDFKKYAGINCRTVTMKPIDESLSDSLLEFGERCDVCGEEIEFRNFKTVELKGNSALVQRGPDGYFAVLSDTLRSSRESRFYVGNYIIAFGRSLILEGFVTANGIYCGLNPHPKFREIFGNIQNLPCYETITIQNTSRIYCHEMKLLFSRSVIVDCEGMINNLELSGQCEDAEKIELAKLVFSSEDFPGDELSNVILNSFTSIIARNAKELNVKKRVDCIEFHIFSIGNIMLGVLSEDKETEEESEGEEDEVKKQSKKKRSRSRLGSEECSVKICDAENVTVNILIECSSFRATNKTSTKLEQQQENRKMKSTTTEQSTFRQFQIQPEGEICVFSNYEEAREADAKIIGVKRVVNEGSFSCDGKVEVDSIGFMNYSKQQGKFKANAGQAFYVALLFENCGLMETKESSELKVVSGGMIRNSGKIMAGGSVVLEARSVFDNVASGTVLSRGNMTVDSQGVVRNSGTVVVKIKGVFRSRLEFENCPCSLLRSYGGLDVTSGQSIRNSGVLEIEEDAVFQCLAEFDNCRGSVLKTCGDLSVTSTCSNTTELSIRNSGEIEIGENAVFKCVTSFENCQGSLLRSFGDLNVTSEQSSVSNSGVLEIGEVAIFKCGTTFEHFGKIKQNEQVGVIPGPRLYVSASERIVIDGPIIQMNRVVLNGSGGGVGTADVILRSKTHIDSDETIVSGRGRSIVLEGGVVIDAENFVHIECSTFRCSSDARITTKGLDPTKREEEASEGFVLLCEESAEFLQSTSSTSSGDQKKNEETSDTKFCVNCFNGTCHVGSLDEDKLLPRFVCGVKIGGSGSRFCAHRVKEMEVTKDGVLIFDVVDFRGVEKLTVRGVIKAKYGEFVCSQLLVDDGGSLEIEHKRVHILPPKREDVSSDAETEEIYINQKILKTNQDEPPSEENGENMNQKKNLEANIQRILSEKEAKTTLVIGSLEKPWKRVYVKDEEKEAVLRGELIIHATDLVEIDSVVEGKILIGRDKKEGDDVNKNKTTRCDTVIFSENCRVIRKDSGDHIVVHARNLLIENGCVIEAESIHIEGEVSVLGIPKYYKEFSRLLDSVSDFKFRETIRDRKRRGGKYPSIWCFSKMTVNTSLFTNIAAKMNCHGKKTSSECHLIRIGNTDSPCKKVSISEGSVLEFRRKCFYVVCDRYSDRKCDFYGTDLVILASQLLSQSHSEMRCSSSVKLVSPFVHRNSCTIISKEFFEKCFVKYVFQNQYYVKQALIQCWFYKCSGGDTYKVTKYMFCAEFEERLNFFKRCLKLKDFESLHSLILRFLNVSGGMKDEMMEECNSKPGVFRRSRAPFEAERSKVVPSWFRKEIQEDKKLGKVSEELVLILRDHKTHVQERRKEIEDREKNSGNPESSLSADGKDASKKNGEENSEVTDVPEKKKKLEEEEEEEEVKKGVKKEAKEFVVHLSTFLDTMAMVRGFPGQVKQKKDFEERLFQDLLTFEDRKLQDLVKVPTIGEQKGRGKDAETSKSQGKTEKEQAKKPEKTPRIIEVDLQPKFWKRARVDCDRLNPVVAIVQEERGSGGVTVKFLERKIFEWDEYHISVKFKISKQVKSRSEGKSSRKEPKKVRKKVSEGDDRFLSNLFEGGNVSDDYSDEEEESEEEEEKEEVEEVEGEEEEEEEEEEVETDAEFLENIWRHLISPTRFSIQGAENVLKSVRIRKEEEEEEEEEEVEIGAKIWRHFLTPTRFSIHMIQGENVLEHLRKKGDQVNPERNSKKSDQKRKGAYRMNERKKGEKMTHEEIMRKNSLKRKRKAEEWEKERRRKLKEAEMRRMALEACRRRRNEQKQTEKRRAEEEKKRKVYLKAAEKKRLAEEKKRQKDEEKKRIAGIKKRKKEIARIRKKKEEEKRKREKEEKKKKKWQKKKEGGIGSIGNEKRRLVGNTTPKKQSMRIPKRKGLVSSSNNNSPRARTTGRNNSNEEEEI